MFEIYIALINRQLTRAFETYIAFWLGCLLALDLSRVSLSVRKRPLHRMNSACYYALLDFEEAFNVLRVDIRFCRWWEDFRVGPLKKKMVVDDLWLIVSVFYLKNVPIFKMQNEVDNQNAISSSEYTESQQNYGKKEIFSKQLVLLLI